MNRIFEELVSYIKQKEYPIYTVAQILGDGEPEIETLHPANPCQDSYSVAKLFVVTAIGILCDRGLLSTESLVTEVLGEEIPPQTRERMDARWNGVTVDMVLSHRLALPHGFLDIDCCDTRTFGNDYLSYLLTYPLTGDHGGDRVYTDGAYYLLARVAEACTGMRLDAFLWRELFGKLGFREVAWSCCSMGHCMGATGLYIETGDMVKLGALYLNGGVYRGERILSREWVDTVISRGYELRPSDEGCLRKGGMRGQMLAVFPEQGRVVAWHAFGFTESADLLSYVAQTQKNADEG